MQLFKSEGRLLNVYKTEKMFKKNTTTLFLLIFIAFGVNSQITVTNTLTPAQLVQNILLGTGVTATNIKYNGSASAALAVKQNATYFNAAGTLFPLADGVLLTTGEGAVAVGPNSASGATMLGTTPDLVDADLSAIAAGNIYNGVKIEFDFVATSDSISFQYIFASEEYPEFVGFSYNDAFGFFLSGPGITGPYTSSGVNIATIPTSTTGLNEVTINNVNDIDNSLYYVDNNTSAAYGDAIEFDGTTVLLTAAAATICGETYHIKLAIANVGDHAWDSGVFLKGGSFSAASNGVAVTSTSISGAAIDSLQLQEGCTITQILYIRPVSGIDTAAVFNIQTSGTLNTATDLLSFSNTVTFPIGVDSIIVTINPLNDGLVEPTEELKIIVYSVSACGDTIFDSLTIFVSDQFDLTFDLPDTIYFSNCLNLDTLVEVTNFAGAAGPYEYEWSNGVLTNPALYTHTSANFDSTYLTVSVMDACSNFYLDSVLMINDFLVPSLTLMPNDTIYAPCIFDSTQVWANVSTPSNGPFSYVWSNSSSIIGNSFVTDTTGVNGGTTPYTVTVTDACGLTDVANGVLIVDQTLTATLSQTAATCAPDGTASSVVAGYVGTNTFQWIGPGLITPDTLTTQNITNISAGWYYYTVSDDVCTFTDSIKVDLITGPIAVLTATPMSTAAPATITFTNSSTDATSYTWDFGNGLNATSSDLSSQTSTYATSGLYVVTLTAWNGPCFNTASIIIELFDEPVIVNVPNVFTPNGDPDNAGFYIKTLNVTEMQLTIVDRWGVLVFEEKNANPKWYGDDYVDGVYFFMYSATGTNGKVLKGNGFLHLIR